MQSIGTSKNSVSYKTEEATIASSLPDGGACVFLAWDGCSATAGPNRNFRCWNLALLRSIDYQKVRCLKVVTDHLEARYVPILGTGHALGSLCQFHETTWKVTNDEIKRPKEAKRLHHTVIR